MSNSGIVLVIITLITILFEGSIGLLFYFKKWKWRWWYTSIYSLFCLIYFVAGRWWRELYDCINHEFISKEITSSNVMDSILLSKAFLLDMCPFLVFVLSIVGIIKQTRSYAQIIAPIGFWTSLTTILLAVSTIDQPLTVQYVFLGIYPNLMFFMMHYLLMTLSMMIMMTTQKYKWWWFIFAFLTIFIYIAYIFLIKYITGANWNLTGLTPNDWKNKDYDFKFLPGSYSYEVYYGEYEQLGRTFHLAYPYGTVFLFLMSALFVIIFIEINTFIHYYINKLRNKLYIKKNSNEIFRIKSIIIRD